MAQSKSWDWTRGISDLARIVFTGTYGRACVHVEHNIDAYVNTTDQHRKQNLENKMKQFVLSLPPYVVSLVAFHAYEKAPKNSTLQRLMLDVAYENISAVPAQKLSDRGQIAKTYFLETEPVTEHIRATRSQALDDVLSCIPSLPASKHHDAAMWVYKCAEPDDTTLRERAIGIALDTLEERKLIDRLHGCLSIVKVTPTGDCHKHLAADKMIDILQRNRQPVGLQESLLAELLDHVPDMEEQDQQTILEQIYAIASASGVVKSRVVRMLDAMDPNSPTFE